jgi:hypothetical protein
VAGSYKHVHDELNYIQGNAVGFDVLTEVVTDDHLLRYIAV